MTDLSEGLPVADGTAKSDHPTDELLAEDQASDCDTGVALSDHDLSESHALSTIEEESPMTSRGRPSPSRKNGNSLDDVTQPYAPR